MGTCSSDNKRLTDEELKVLRGKFLIDNGYDIDDSYVCVGYLQRYCDKLEIRTEQPLELSTLELSTSIKHIWPVQLNVGINPNGIVVRAGYN